MQTNKRFTAPSHTAGRAPHRTTLLATLTLCIASVGPLWAHDSHIAAHYLLGPDKTGAPANQWRLNMNFSHGALVAALQRRYGKDNVLRLNGEQLQRLAVDYINDTTAIDAETEDGRRHGLTPRVVGVQLGSHQSLLQFNILEVPENPTAFHITMRAAGENPDHTNMLFLRTGKHSSRTVIPVDAAARVSLGKPSQPLPTGFKVLFGFGIVGLIFVVSLFWPRRNSHAASAAAGAQASGSRGGISTESPSRIA